jgi:hypothetical protein
MYTGPKFLKKSVLPTGFQVGDVVRGKIESRIVTQCLSKVSYFLPKLAMSGIFVGQKLSSGLSFNLS